MQPLFQKRIENFTCLHCGTVVEGNGYTNHCPRCLYSQHVDVHPGDRADACRGLMEPIGLEGSTGTGYILRHKCVKCGHERVNRVGPQDNTDAVIALAAAIAQKQKHV